MALFSTKKENFLVAALAAVGVSDAAITTALAANDAAFLSDIAAFLSDTAALTKPLEDQLAALKTASAATVARAAQLEAACVAAGLKPEAVAADAGFLKDHLATEASRLAAETLSKHGLKPLPNANAHADAGAKTMPFAEFRALPPHAQMAFVKGGGNLTE
jgi:enamine deaminase RidA (YjgF/YER057c/UK114 family)